MSPRSIGILMFVFVAGVLLLATSHTHFDPEDTVATRSSRGYAPVVAAPADDYLATDSALVVHGEEEELSTPSDTSMLTVVTMSYPQSTRFHLLQEIIRRARSWPFVAEVLLVWNGDESLLPDSVRQLVNSTIQPGLGAALGGLRQRSKRAAVAPVTLVPQAHNRVDNRWRIGRLLSTAAALNLDDDVDLAELGAICLFNVWRASPKNLVAVDVRSHYSHRAKKGSAGPGPYGEWGYAARDTTSGFKSYSIALPRALIAPREYYLAYDTMWRRNDSGGIRDIVDRLLCDDIAFNFVAANATKGGAGPSVIYAKAKFRPYPESHSKNAMFNKPGMKPFRQRCVNELANYFGHMPLWPRSWHVLCEVDG